MTDPESLIAQIKQAGHEVSERMHFGGSDYPVKAIPYAKFLEVLSVFEATYRAEVRADVVAEEPEWEYGEQSRLDPNTVWIVDPDSQSMIWADIPSEKRVRRRVAGPWVPVKQEGTDQ